MVFELLWHVFASITYFVMIVLGALLVYTCYMYTKHLVSLRKYPSGPFPLPIIGNLHQLGNRPHENFTELKKTYGDVYSISLGMQRWVIINTVDVAREALINNSVAFAGRPTDHFIFHIMSKGKKCSSFNCRIHINLKKQQKQQYV